MLKISRRKTDAEGLKDFFKDKKHVYKMERNELREHAFTARAVDNAAIYWLFLKNTLNLRPLFGAYMLLQDKQKVVPASAREPAPMAERS